MYFFMIKKPCCDIVSYFTTLGAETTASITLLFMFYCSKHQF